MLNKLKLYTLILLFLLCGTFPVYGQSVIPVSPYDFPFGYPFLDYPLGGASHPSLSNDYMSDPVYDGDIKRVAQYALRLLQTERAAEALEYVDEFQGRFPGYMDQEIWFMRSMAQSHLGRLDESAESMSMAIETAELPPQRFLAGPRRMFAPLHSHEAFIALWEKHKNDLVHGPMLGDMSDSSVRVWVRTLMETPVRVAVSTSPEMADPVISAPVLSRADDDYTAEIVVEGLEPETRYYYDVLVGSEQQPFGGKGQSFRTYPAEGHPADFDIVFGGGGGYTPFNERIWDTIRRFDPTAFFTLGDNVYIDDPESPEQQRLMYYQRQSRPEFRRLVGSTPAYAIWDDHDFAMDDSWGGPEVNVPYWKPMVWEIFRENWANPSYGGGEEQPGVWFDFRIADVHFILLDGRYYREDPGRFGGEGVPNPTMLGPHQLEWLQKTLMESEATFKVLVSPVPWHLEAKPGQAGVDTWAGYQEEREEIFSWISEHEIDGVILMAADRHRSDAWLTEREDSYDLYEFQSSQFTNIHTHPVMDESLFGYNEKNSFGWLRFNTKAEDPEVTYRIVDIDGKLQHSFTVKLSQLRN
jgi:alkaline phosphatase D